MQIIRCLLPVFVVLVISVSLFAQTPGIPPFSVLDRGLYDTVKINDGGILLTLPVRNKAAVIPFNYSLIANINVTADSLNRAWINPVFYGQTSAGVSPTLSVGVLSANQTLCPDGITKTIQHTGYFFMDGFGTKHVYKFLTTDTQACLLDDFLYDVEQGGYSFSINQDGSNPVVTDSSGNQIIGTVMTDPNGNVLSVGYTDPTLVTPMTETTTVVNGLTTKDVHAWTDALGHPQNFTITYSNYTQKTNFGCSTLVDVGPTTKAYPSSITTPEGTYTITYEPTPGYSGDVTGRIAKVVFPSGARIEYSYTGGSNGISCPYSLVPVLTRKLTDANGNVSIWKYDTAAVTNATVVTDPSGNDTVHTFSPGCCSNRTNFETLTQFYQGPRTGTGLLKTNTICYNGNSTNCPTATVRYVTQKDVYTLLPGMSQQSLSETTYTNLGLVTEDKEYDFGPVLVSDRVITYGSYANGSCSAIPNISNRVCTDVLKNGSGTVLAQTNNTYDGLGNLLSSGRLTTGSTYLTQGFTHNLNGTVNIATDVNGAQTTYGNYTCNSNFPTTVSEPLGLSKSMTWDCNGGAQTSLKDENLVTTHTNFTSGSTADPFYRPLSVVDPINNTTAFGYTAIASEGAMDFNGSISTTDALSTADGVGHLIFAQKRQSQSSNYFDSTQNTYGWNSTGAFVKQSVLYSGTAAQPAPAGTAVTTTQYDALGRPLTVTDGGGGTISYTYPKNDVLLSVGPTQNFQKQLEYDALGRLTSVCEITSAAGSGSCLQSNSATGFLTKYAYDALGNLLTVTQNAQPGAIGGTQTRSFTYDGLSRLLSESNPETGAISYVYDSDSTCGTSKGDLVKRVDNAGNVICFAYDALHRNTGITYPSGPNSASTPSKTFVYDSTTFTCPTGANVAGRLAEAYTGPSTAKITDTAFCYSPRGEITDVFESTPNSGGYYHTTASYWANGALNTLGGVPGLSGWTFTPDGEGRPYSVTYGASTNWVTGASYYPSNGSNPPSNNITFGSGDNDVYGFDPSTGRMNSFQFTVGSTPKTLTGTLGWNANGTLGALGIVDQFNSSDTQNCNYVYDDLARAQSVNCVNGATNIWNQTFTLDPFGNISKSGSISFAAAYLLPNGTTNNQEQSVSSCIPTYDANGNMTKDCSFSSPPTYTWDSDGNPIKLRSANITSDALDREVEIQNGTTITQILYGPTGKLGLMNGQTAKKIRIPLPGGSTAQIVGTSATYILHADWLGSARLTTSYTGRSMTYDTAYAPYGENYSSTSTSTAYLDFTGQFQDTMTGLNDFLNREHDPVQGRWTSPDPAGLGAVEPTNPQSWNRYAYVANAPLSATDPLGLSSNSDGSGGSDGCFGGDLGGRFECILPDGLAGPPILAGDGPPFPNPTIPLVVTIVNVNASPGNGAIPEWLWWEFPWVFTPRPPLVNPTCYYALRNPCAANNPTKQQPKKACSAVYNQFVSDMNSLNTKYALGWKEAFGSGIFTTAVTQPSLWRMAYRMSQANEAILRFLGITAPVAYHTAVAATTDEGQERRALANQYATASQQCDPTK